MTTTTPLVRVDTTVNTDVKYSKVFALAFVKIEGVTAGVFTEDQLRAFVIPKLSDATLFGSAIVQLDSLATGHNYHSGKGDETFTGLLTKVFVLVSDLTTNVTTTIQGADFADAGIDVYFVTMDGVNETAMSINITNPVYTRPLTAPLPPSGVSVVNLTANIPIFNNRTEHIITSVHPDFEGHFYYRTANEVNATPSMTFDSTTLVYVITNVDLSSIGTWELYNGTGENTIVQGNDIMSFTNFKVWTSLFPPGTHAFGATFNKWAMII